MPTRPLITAQWHCRIYKTHSHKHTHTRCHLFGACIRAADARSLLEFSSWSKAAAFCKIVNSNSLSFVCVCHGYRRKRERILPLCMGYGFSDSQSARVKNLSIKCMCAQRRVTLWSARRNGGLAAPFPSLFALFRSQIHPSAARHQMPQCYVRVYIYSRSYQQNCYYTFRFWGPGAVLWLYLKHISFALCRRRLLLKQKSYQCAPARASYNNIWKREQRRNVFCEINADFAHAEK